MPTATLVVGVWISEVLASIETSLAFYCVCQWTAMYS